MKFVEVKEVENIAKKNEINKFLKEFLESGIQIAKVENEGNYKNNTIMCASIRKEINKDYADKIAVKTSGGEVYLFRLEEDKEETQDEKKNNKN